MDPLTLARRRQLTRDALVSAAEEVSARQGFEGASLKEIAAAAGFSRGAIYSNFGGKEQFFLAVAKRFNEQFLAQFRDFVDAPAYGHQFDLVAIADRWRAMPHHDPQRLALGLEFTLHLLRNPAARERVLEERRQISEMVARFIAQGAVSLGTTLMIPAETLARIVLAATDGLQLASFFDPEQDDLYEPFLKLLLSALTPPSSEPRRCRSPKEGSEGDTILGAERAPAATDSVWQGPTAVDGVDHG